jgi:hypothetical protein
MSWNRQSFLESWRTAIAEAGRQTVLPGEGWQGPVAYKALKKLNLLEVVSFKPGPNLEGYQGWRLGWVLRDFGNAVDAHERGLDVLNEQRTALERNVEFLKLADRSLGSALHKSVPEDLEHSMRKTRQLLKKEIRARTAQIEDQYCNLAILLRGSGALRKAIRVRDRSLDLESKFQFNIACLLLKYLYWAAPQAARKLRFANISRLVLLFYFAAGLATRKTRSSALYVRSYGRLTQKAVDQNLTRAGLRKVDFRPSALARTRGLAVE